MGDKSPKSNRKQDDQKKVKSDGEKQKKKNEQADKAKK